MNMLRSLARDASFALRLLPPLLAAKRHTMDSSDTFAARIEHWARTTPEGIAILFEDEVITWAAYDAAANRWARWAAGQGVGHGDVVALMIANRPEFLFAWAGLAKLGAVSALINTNLSGGPLAHSLRISGASHLAADAEYAAALAEALPQLEAPPRVWITGGEAGPHEDLDPLLAGLSAAPLDPATRSVVTGRDGLFYIYTSGTTGNPKAANFSHARAMQAALAFGGVAKATAADRMYLVLPLYHSAGGVMAVGMMLVAGGTIVLRRRFSATAFWDDCATYGVTMVQYIGELCRYLNNAPPHPLERAHRLKVMVGNGLRPDIWQAFQDRFGIPRIVEFYSATEGNVVLINVDGKVGSIGRIPGWLDSVLKVRLVRLDLDTGQPVRGQDGLCIVCAPGEAGEAVGFIPSDPRVSVGRYEGYRDAEETSRKVLRDVLEKGDSWFRTGDLLRRDAEGYFQFVDRIGDTFRWKGENVATSEVAEAVSVFPGIREANVYGVQMPGADGRAGMAAVVADPDLDLAGLAAHLARQLPAYAVPLFLRLRGEIEITGTFKHRKVELAREGFDPALTTDPLFMRDAESGRYLPLDAARHAEVVAAATSGTLRL